LQKGKRPLNTIYPSKSFFAEAAKAINAHEKLEIYVNGGWRGKILAKEVERWLPFDEIDLLKKGWKSPSLWCSIFMVRLHGIYYTALSANYEMRTDVKGDLITLTFLPL
jgi:hypothetical protein